MALTTQAPVAPTQSVTKVLEAFRDTGLGGGPVTVDLIGRMGIGDEVARRVVQSLRLLGLIDKDGQATENLTAFRHAPSGEYKQLLAEQLYDVYAPVFAVTGKNLAAKTPNEVEDAFRRFQPASLRKRMVTLFLGLCQYAGIVETVPARKPGPKLNNGGRQPAAKKTATAKRGGHKNDDKAEERRPPTGTLDAARQRYVDLLIAKAESQETTDQDLLDRIERALGIGGGTS
jgi:Family of unknown function (DUF5343)